MTMHPSHLLREAQVPALPTAPLPAPRSLFDWAGTMLTDVLLKPGRDGVALYDRAIDAARPRSGPNPEPLDPLLQAMGWTQDDMPDLGQHLFVSAMGSVFERLIHAIFAHTRPKLYSTDWDALARAHDLPRAPRQGKRWGDFLLGNTAIEAKYRYGSGQSAEYQGACAKRLRALGKHPVMLALRPSPNAQAMRSYGWEVHEGTQAIAYISQTTGVDLARLATACCLHPVFVQHAHPRMQRWKDARTASLEAAALAMPPGELAAYIARLQHALTTPAPAA